METSWEAVIGLEIHVQLNTNRKIFSGASCAYGAAPNHHISPIDIGLPGTLPVPNRAAVEKAICFGLAVDAEIAECSIFARKNYFYPDLAKGYQISQHEAPIVSRGHLKVRSPLSHEVIVEIERAHLEEDAGKSVHDAFHASTGIDFNRAGSPLLEIVTTPCLHHAADAVAYMKAIHHLVMWLDICDGNLQEGSLRCDANVSVRPQGTAQLGTRTEIKNVNSFRFVEKAIEYEIERHIRVLESGGTIVQETRLYDETRHQTRPMRDKESAMDYRYFPDPDLPALHISKEKIAEIQSQLPELPEVRRQRYYALGLSEYDTDLLLQKRAIADYFEALLLILPEQAKLCANWINGELTAALNEANIDIMQCPISAAQLSLLLQRLVEDKISTKAAKTVFHSLWQQEGSVDEIIAEKSLAQIQDDDALHALLTQFLQAHPEQAEKCRQGDEKMRNWMIGELMKATRGKANPAKLKALLLTQKT